MSAETQAELLPFLKERRYHHGQVLETELGNNTLSNSLRLDVPINSTDGFSTYKRVFSHLAPRGLINLRYRVCFK